MPQVLMVIAPDQFRDEEYAEPRAVLESRGADVVTGSVAPGPCRGKLGMLARADVALFDTTADEYAAIVFVGGAGAAVFFDDADAHRLAREAVRADRVVAAICVGPSILAHAGLLDGRTATAFPSRQEDLVAHGATFSGRPVEIDGRIVTANGPDAAHEFGQAIADAMKL